MVGDELKDAARKGLVRTNVGLNADPPSEKASQAPETKVWTPAQARQFLASVAVDPDALLWRFYLATGCRRGEALGLRWSDVDLDAGRISITQQFTMVGAAPTMLAVKSDRSRRVVDLDPATIDALHRHRIEQAEHKLALGESYDPDELGLVFAKPTVRHTTPSACQRGSRYGWNGPGSRCFGSTTCATRLRRSCSPPGSKLVSSRSASGTPRSPSRWPATRRCCPERRPRRQPATPACSTAPTDERSSPCRSLDARRHDGSRDRW